MGCAGTKGGVELWVEQKEDQVGRYFVASGEQELTKLASEMWLQSKAKAIVLSFKRRFSAPPVKSCQTAK